MRTFAWVLVLAGLLDGCATNTPQQDYIYDMARPCEGKGIRLDYVSPDGQQWRGLVIHPSSSMPEFAQCLRENATRTPFEKWKRDNNINWDRRDRPLSAFGMLLRPERPDGRLVGARHF